MANNKIFCLLGKSGTGKNSILSKILSDLTELHKMIPVTTRKPRIGEINNLDYKFITHKEFLKLKSKNKLLEYRQYDMWDDNDNRITNFYGHEFPENYSYSIMEGPWDMYQSIKYNENYNIIPIYIIVNDIERLYRMISRESQNPVPNYHETARRFVQDNIDYPNNEIYTLNRNSIFVNEDLTTCQKMIIDYIKFNMEE